MSSNPTQATEHELEKIAEQHGFAKCTTDECGNHIRTDIRDDQESTVTYEVDRITGQHVYTGDTLRGTPNDHIAADMAAREEDDAADKDFADQLWKGTPQDKRPTERMQKTFAHVIREAHADHLRKVRADGKDDDNDDGNDDEVERCTLDADEIERVFEGALVSMYMMNGYYPAVSKNRNTDQMTAAILKYNDIPESKHPTVERQVELATKAMKVLGGMEKALVARVQEEAKSAATTAEKELMKLVEEVRATIANGQDESPALSVEEATEFLTQLTMKDTPKEGVLADKLKLYVNDAIEAVPRTAEDEARDQEISDLIATASKDVPSCKIDVNDPNSVVYDEEGATSRLTEKVYSVVDSVADAKIKESRMQPADPTVLVLESVNIPPAIIEAIDAVVAKMIGRSDFVPYKQLRESDNLPNDDQLTASKPDVDKLFPRAPFVPRPIMDNEKSTDNADDDEASQALLDNVRIDYADSWRKHITPSIRDRMDYAILWRKNEQTGEQEFVMYDDYHGNREDFENDDRTTFDVVNILFNDTVMPGSVEDIRKYKGNMFSILTPALWLHLTDSIPGREDVLRDLLYNSEHECSVYSSDVPMSWQGSKKQQVVHQRRVFTECDTPLAWFEKQELTTAHVEFFHDHDQPTHEIAMRIIQTDDSLNLLGMEELSVRTGQLRTACELASDRFTHLSTMKGSNQWRRRRFVIDPLDSTSNTAVTAYGRLYAAPRGMKSASYNCLLLAKGLCTPWEHHYPPAMGAREEMAMYNTDLIQKYLFMHYEVVARGLASGSLPFVFGFEPNRYLCSFVESMLCLPAMYMTELLQTDGMNDEGFEIFRLVLCNALLYMGDNEVAKVKKRLMEHSNTQYGLRCNEKDLGFVIRSISAYDKEVEGISARKKKSSNSAKAGKRNVCLPTQHHPNKSTKGRGIGKVQMGGTNRVFPDTPSD